MKRFAMISLLLAATLPAGAKTVELRSPDRKYVMSLSDEGGRPCYTLSWNGTEMISKSGLGIDMGPGLAAEAGISSVTGPEKKDSEWSPVYGEYSRIRDRYNSYVVKMVHAGSGQPYIFDLEVRMYDEGVAFRYLFPSGHTKVLDEFTEFTVPEGSMAYFTPRAQTPHTLLPISDWPGDGESDRPLLIRTPESGYILLGEAQLVNYARTKFRVAEGRPGTITTAMYGPVELAEPSRSPWRLVMCGEKAGDILAHNYIYYNLNPECRIGDTSWIKPGKVMREITLSTEGAMALVDFAVKRNIQYIHFDAGWYGYENDPASDATTVTLDPRRNPKADALDLPKAIAYAKSKGLGVILYVNQKALSRQLDEILPLYRSWGISGIKFGFVEVGSQEWTDWLHKAVMKCAEYGLMVDIHDEYRPTGFSRTYPNLMTQEGVRGNEEFPDGFNNTVLPFTRFVCGPADYTICYYYQDFDRIAAPDDADVPYRNRTLKTTPGHQLALSVVYYSPLQYMYWYDRPSDSQDEPELKFFDDVYTVWDDTRILEGEPGEYVSIARRHGSEWFVGTIANSSRTAVIDLDFLPRGKFTAEIYTDGDRSIPTRTKVKVTRERVTRKSTLTFDLRRNGGAAVRIVPISHP